MASSPPTAEMAAASVGATLNINVGILGHVDSGKTSLSRALSSTASTNAFDKNPQSKERGITLDLGFSSFLTSLPAQLAGGAYSQMQVTLVDCPGHASLIRTIIGGAQIIDLMLLVIDVTKGIQTQTAECLVIGEILNDTLIVVLNKTDMLPEAGREEKLSKMKARIRKTLAATKFADAPMVAIAARPGGAESAASDASGGAAAVGVSALVDELKARVALPERRHDGPLHFAIDHCFPIKGQGTVLTGTVLSGSLKIGQEIEFPELKQTRKIKSMQMFRKPVQSATQGDRLGVCVTQLDAKALERGIACTPGYISTVSCALVAVRHIRFFKTACKTGAKFHVTVGHATVMGTATFFGPPGAAAAEAERQAAVEGKDEAARKAAQAARALAVARAPLPTSFADGGEHLYQEELDTAAPDQWCVLQLEQPVACALPATAICSHLETDHNLNACRIAFYGKLVRSLAPDEVPKLRVFKRKRKEGQVERLHDDHTLICKNLFRPGTDMTPFFGMEVQVGESGPVGRIDSTFGKTKFKVAFPSSLEPGVLADACKGARIYLNYKRFVFDTEKRMIQH